MVSITGRVFAYAFFIVVGLIAITPKGPIPIWKVIIGIGGIILSIALFAIDVLGIGQKSANR